MKKKSWILISQQLEVKMSDNPIRIEGESLWKDYWFNLGEIGCEILESFRLRRFNHPNIVKVLDIKITLPHPSIEEYYRNVTKDRFRAPRYYNSVKYNIEAGCVSFKLERGDMDLEKYMKMGLGLTRKDRLEICFKVAQALYCLHRSDLVHGDLKPANVVMYGSEPKLIDMGYSLYSETTYLAVTPFYGSYRCNSKRADLYSLGLIFNYVLTEMPAIDMKQAHYRLISARDKGGKLIGEWEERIRELVTEPLLQKMVNQDLPLTIEEVIQDPIFNEVFYQIDFEVFPAPTTLETIYQDVLGTLGEPEDRRDLYYYFLVARLIYSGEIGFSLSKLSHQIDRSDLTRLTGLEHLYIQDVAERSGDLEELKRLHFQSNVSPKVLQFLERNPNVVYPAGEDDAMFETHFLLSYLSQKEWI